MTALVDPDPRVRGMAARLLADAPGDDTLDALLAALDDPEPRGPRLVGRGADRQGRRDPEHIERGEAELDRLLGEGPHERTAALHALGPAWSPTPDDTLDRLLRDGDAEIRAAAASTLAADADTDVGGADRLLMSSRIRPSRPQCRRRSAVGGGVPAVRPGRPSRLAGPSGPGGCGPRDDRPRDRSPRRTVRLGRPPGRPGR